MLFSSYTTQIVKNSMHLGKKNETLCILLQDGEKKVVDTVTSYFGIRSIEIRSKEIYIIHPSDIQYDKYKIHPLDV